MKKGLLGLITICLFHAGACQSMTALRRAGASTRAAANRGYQNARSWMGYKAPLHTTAQKPEQKPPVRMIPVRATYEPELGSYPQKYGTIQGQKHLQSRDSLLSRVLHESIDSARSAVIPGTVFAAGLIKISDPVFLSEHWAEVAAFPVGLVATTYGIYLAMLSFEKAMAKIKNSARKRFMTDSERINNAYQQIETRKSSLSNLPIDIINEPLLPGKLTLLQAALNIDPWSGTIINLLSVGADPNFHALGTLHPIECVLDSRNNKYFGVSWDIVLMLVNPYLTKTVSALPLAVEQRLIDVVEQERGLLVQKTLQSTNQQGYFIPKDEKDVRILDKILTLDQIMYALGQRKALIAEQYEASFSRISDL